MYRGLLNQPAPPGFGGRNDVIGAAGGADISSLDPDAQAFLLRSLAAHLDAISAVILTNSQAPAEQVEYEVDASNLAGGQSYKMPSGMAIVSYYIENNSGATLNVFAGASAIARSINSIAGYSWKSALCPQQITSLTIAPSVATATGLVRVVLTASVLGPGIGSTLGATSTPPSATATVTTPTIGTSWIQLLPANPNRVGATVYDASGSASLAVGLGSATQITTVAPFATYTPPVNWRGSIWAQATAANTASIVTEFTP